MEYAWLGTTSSPACPDRRTTADRRCRTGVDPPPPGAAVLRGLTLPGLANAHTHAFHRALRGAVQSGAGPGWGRGLSARTLLDLARRHVQVADRLTPDSYFALARAVYAEMALAGITCVGEFHYLHHDAGRHAATPTPTPWARP